MAEQVISQFVRGALEELQRHEARSQKPFWWRRASMAKLAVAGLVEEYDAPGDPKGLKIRPHRMTDAGRAFLAPIPHTPA
jgi:hypothetical protein